MKKTLLLMLLLMTGIARADVFKCKTSAGIIYSERPCPTGSEESNIQSVQNPDQPQSEESVNEQPARRQTSQSGIDDVNAVPLPAPEKRRKAYEAFLARPNPRAFIICNDGRVMTFSGNESFLKQRLSSLPDGYTPYAIDNDVVWTGK